MRYNARLINIPRIYQYNDRPLPRPTVLGDGVAKRPSSIYSNIRRTLPPPRFIEVWATYENYIAHSDYLTKSYLA